MHKEIDLSIIGTFCQYDSKVEVNLLIHKPVEVAKPTMSGKVISFVSYSKSPRMRTYFFERERLR